MRFGLQSWVYLFRILTQERTILKETTPATPNCSVFLFFVGPFKVGLRDTNVATVTNVTTMFTEAFLRKRHAQCFDFCSPPSPPSTQKSEIWVI